jgi:hypothetical protein
MECDLQNAEWKTSHQTLYTIFVDPSARFFIMAPLSE